MNHGQPGWKHAVLATVFCLTGWAASAAEIRDDAKIFSREAVVAAEQRLNAAQIKAKQDVTIETYATLPSGKAPAVTAMSSRERAEFYSNWLKQRARQSHAQGLSVLITKEPGHVEVGVSGKLQAAGFTAANKKAVIDAFLTSFRAKEFDRGLTDAVQRIESGYATLQPVAAGSRPISPDAPAHAPRPAPYAPAPNSIGGWTIGGMLMIGAVIFVIWIILSAIGRAFSGGTAGPMGYGGSYGPNYGGGGGGFGRGLMGGLLGGMAGSWLYDSFGRSNQAHGSDQGGSIFGGGASGHSGGDDWSTSGGDFGGGGGDFGGGDSSGGDF